MSRWYERTAIVLWPRRSRVRILGLEAGVSLLLDAVRGSDDDDEEACDEDERAEAGRSRKEALSGYASAEALFRACAGLPGQTSRSREQLLRAASATDASCLSDDPAQYILNRL